MFAPTRRRPVSAAAVGIVGCVTARGTVYSVRKACPREGGDRIFSTEPPQAERTEAQQDRASDDATGPATAADTGAGGRGDATAARLAPGALRGLVEDYLRDHPGEEFGPTAIAKALGGKSSGAVSNALDKLVEDGTAVKTQDTPRRFALAPAEAATAPTPTK